MISIDRIEALIQEKLGEDDYFIVSLDISRDNKIKLVIDSLKGITIEECVSFSRAIEHNLDRDIEDFELEVTSPGLNMPLKVIQQYFKNIGRELELTKKDNTKIKGKLKQVDKDEILIFEREKKRLEGHKKKQLVETEHKIKFADIDKAFVVIKF